MSSLGQRTEGHWFESIAAFLGPAYLNYSFTKGTAQDRAKFEKQVSFYRSEFEALMSGNWTRSE